MATEKQILALVATGEAGKSFMATSPESVVYKIAATTIDSQRDCVVCGNGMIVLPWAKVVDPDDRLSMLVRSASADINIPIHRGCLLDASAGARIAEAISLAKRPCGWDADGRESVAEARLTPGAYGQTDSKWVGICQQHLDNAQGAANVETRPLQ